MKLFSSEPTPLSKIGRFEIISILGKGAQGTVYLASDPHLQRQVAIKTLHLEQGDQNPNRLTALLEEARIVSQFQHPNIVTVHDAGEQAGSPYLVFEYVAGTTLADLLKQQRLSIARAVEIAGQILDGIAYAHQKAIVHRDLKPANIMIDANGIARIMDFGIALSLANDPPEALQGAGTPYYIAPETITLRRFDARSDIFSLGMMLYQMLTGAPAVRGSSVAEILDRIVNQPYSSPSHANHEISEKLDGIVLKALAKNPLDRFENAAAMQTALHNYLHPEEGEPFQVESAQSTVEFLLRRMRHKSDFPAVSKTISDINNIVASDHDGAAKLSKVILADFALTNKLLKMVNTAHYGQFGATISTISRAVVILGFEAIRNAAITLLLFDHLQNKAQAGHLKDETIATFFNGVIGKALSGKNGVKDAEEAFICAMFRNLGKLLATFYFYEESLEISNLMQQQAISEAHASYKVLGVSYEELGIGIARAWHFPEQIIYSMRGLGEDKSKKPHSEADRLRLISNISCELSRVAANTPIADRSKELTQIIKRYGEAMPLSEKTLVTVMEHALDEMKRHAAVLNINIPQSAFIKRVTLWSGKTAIEVAPVSKREEDDAILEHSLDNTVRLAVEGAITEEVLEGASAHSDPAEVLAAGIQDIMNTLVGDYTLNDILRMILETMYRAMGFSRVLVCIKDARDNTMHGRFGFGLDIDACVKAFKIPLSFSPDVFHVALSKGVDILINDINAENIKNRIPDWYRKKVPAHSFLIFPIMLDKAPIAMIYADQSSVGMSIQAKELNLLKTLRNQAVLAIKQKV